MEIKRQQEIARLIIIQMMKEKGIQEGLMRDLGNTAKKIDIKPDELKQFVESILPEVLAGILGRQSVKLILA